MTDSRQLGELLSGAAVNRNVPRTLRPEYGLGPNAGLCCWWFVLVNATLTAGSCHLLLPAGACRDDFPMTLNRPNGFTGRTRRANYGGHMADSLIPIAAVLLVDRAGRLLLQLRDEHAPNYPNVWGLPGGHGEPGESPAQTAIRELWEETRLRPDGDLVLFARQELPEFGRVTYYFCGATSASQDDVVVGEGAAIVFTSPDEVLDGRPFAPGTVETLARFLASDEYALLFTCSGLTQMP